MTEQHDTAEAARNAQLVAELQEVLKGLIDSMPGHNAMQRFAAFLAAAAVASGLPQTKIRRAYERAWGRMTGRVRRRLLNLP